MSRLGFGRSAGWTLPRPSARGVPLTSLKMRRFLWCKFSLSIAKDSPRWGWSNRLKSRPTGWHCSDIVRGRLSILFWIVLWMGCKWRHRGCRRSRPRRWGWFRYRMSSCRSGRTTVSSSWCSTRKWLNQATKTPLSSPLPHRLPCTPRRDRVCCDWPRCMLWSEFPINFGPI